MAQQPETGTSVWVASAKIKERPALSRKQNADVCIVGGGIAGLSTAYQLLQDGLKVVVLDAGPGGGGETPYTTAHLACALDDRFVEVEKTRGVEASRLAAASHAAAIDRIEAIVKGEEIDCDFLRVDGFLFDPEDKDSPLILREYEAARRAGLSVEILGKAPLPNVQTGLCLRFPRQGQFHPLKYLAELTRVIEDKGGRIFNNTRVQEVQGGNEAHVETKDGKRVEADHIVVATNTPINDIVAIHTKQAPYLTYAIAAPIPKGKVAFGLYWDTLDPYHYVRLQPGESAGKGLDKKLQGTHDVLIVGGEDHKTGQAANPEEHYQRLEAWARERFATMGDLLWRWSGQVMETVDGLGFIGRNPGDEPNVYIATGDSGMGMTHGVIASLLLPQLIMGREHPWTELYEPSRKPIRAGWEYVKENVNVAFQYVDWLTGGDVGSVDEIKPGHGGVVRRGMSKVAVYRDEKGKLHERSASCPHLGCVVRWNDVEQTWDCPCHGSRFKADGTVQHGPAISDLKKLDE